MGDTPSTQIVFCSHQQGDPRGGGALNRVLVEVNPQTLQKQTGGRGRRERKKGRGREKRKTERGREKGNEGESHNFLKKDMSRPERWASG